MTPYVEKSLFREGILKPGPFTDNYDLRCYEPSKSMEPFVEHYFISRRRSKYDPHYVGSDVLSQPVVSLFIKPDTAYFEGPTVHKRTLRTSDTSFYAGVQFRPGGFHSFWHKPISDLAEKTIPANAIIPGLTSNYAQKIVAQTDNQTLLHMIESQIEAQKPQAEPSIDLINNIIAEIERRGGSMTVSELAAQFNMSERTLQHLFKVYVGVGAKWAIMRARFLEVIKFAREQQKPDWTVVAAEFGYSDQSHFINDFKRLVGSSPAQYMSTLKTT